LKKVLRKKDQKFIRQPAIEQQEPRIESETICFSIFRLGSLSGKRGNTGEEKLCVTSALPLLAVDPLLWLEQSKPLKRIESEKANRIKTNNNNPSCSPKQSITNMCCIVKYFKLNFQ